MALQPFGCVVLGIFMCCTGYKIDKSNNIRAKHTEQIGTPALPSNASSSTILHTNDSIDVAWENITDKSGRYNASDSVINDESLDITKINGVKNSERALPNHSLEETSESTWRKTNLQNTHGMQEFASMQGSTAVNNGNSSFTTMRGSNSSQNNVQYSLKSKQMHKVNKTTSVTDAAANNSAYFNRSSKIHTNGGAYHKHGAHTRHDKNNILWTNSKQHQLVFGHHLQLVPMEDEPFGAVIIKDQRFMVSVLIPVGIGMFGAALIITTLYVMRYMAQKQARQLADTASSRGPPIQNISSEVDDKAMLLSRDEDDEF